ncbi:uncharacterized protein RCC_02922 [Ramularia collo-cygni]|uniref:Uncharacterized protein n=1 Tax=Ramularia collo-cygni TaxID=112498 RepID=A0A2D3UVM0_9PEZI|nr:uncharacterized protein RCC_02922 [Ramularia collo-cygni]CZT17090.1 uncharacterized protein RCC_02922 [Ramularia collo-cygni]
MAPSDKKSLKEIAQQNPTQLGDPVSLKAETSNTEPTDQDRPVKGQSKEQPKKTLKQMVEANPTALGDPVSLKAEKSDTEPTDQDRGALSKSSGRPKM